MAITTLSYASALNPGSELWVVADLAHSNWTSRLDWYLNFQILKAQRHQAEKPSSFLISVVNKTGLELPQKTTTAESPLLISSAHLLPNRWVAVIPMDQGLESWTKKAGEVWSKLGKPSLRIFTPTGQSAGSFTELWTQNFLSEDFTVVLD